MRVVLDANLPVDFGKLLTGHQVDSVHQRGWSDLDNGALLTACQEEYDAFLTLTRVFAISRTCEADRSR